MPEKTWWGSPAPSCDFCQQPESFPVEVSCEDSEDGCKLIAACERCMIHAKTRSHCETRLRQLRDEPEIRSWVWEGHSADSVGELYEKAIRASDQGRGKQASIYWSEAERSLMLADMRTFLQGTFPHWRPSPNR